jgi:hypothetical protein
MVYIVSSFQKVQILGHASSRRQPLHVHIVNPSTLFHILTFFRMVTKMDLKIRAMGSDGALAHASRVIQ